MSDDRWFTTTFNVSAEAATLAEADTVFDQIKVARAALEEGACT